MIDLTKADRLSDSDRILLQRASEMMKQAQTVNNFVSQHLAPIYGIDQETKVNVDTGDIVRPSVMDTPHR
jgi:hypothetical protein